VADRPLVRCRMDGTIVHATDGSRPPKRGAGTGRNGLSIGDARSGCGWSHQELVTSFL